MPAPLAITDDFDFAVENGWIYSASAANADATRRCLLVFVHGFGETVDEYASCLCALIHAPELAAYDLLPFSYATLRWRKKSRRSVTTASLSRRYNWLSNQHPEDIAGELSRRIQAAAANGYRRVRIIAHSFGALLTRAAVLQALDVCDGLDHRWLRNTDRLILLAGTNRGFMPDRATYRLLLLCPYWAKTAQRGLRGSRWVTALRLRWLDRAMQTPSPLPKTVQILGRDDRIVGSDDSVEIYQYPAHEQHEVEDITHMDFLHIGKPENAALLQRVIAAIAGPRVDPVPRPLVPTPERIIFLVHGIRDFGDWQESIECAVQQRLLEQARLLGAATDAAAAPDAARAAPVLAHVKVISVRCGRFSALQFFSLGRRRWNVQAFADRYVQERCKAPHATFCVAAHSLGTLVLARALQRYSNVMRFERAFLVGSVLPTGFPWSRFAIGRLHNVCGASDRYVGWLCRTLRALGYRHLGTSGVHGFADAQVEQEFHKGGHSDWLKPAHQKDIARFLVNIDLPPLPVEKTPHTGADNHPGQGLPFVAGALALAWAFGLMPDAEEFRTCLQGFVLLAGLIWLLDFF